MDVNADLGEGVLALATEVELLRLLDSVNIACGFHAGDARTMAALSAAAVDLGVRIGAHVSYHDREHFGRRELGTSPDTIRSEVAYQVGALVGTTRLHGGTVTYVKPHGALYWRCQNDRQAAKAALDGLLAASQDLAVMVAPGSLLGAVAEERGIPVIREGFIDRRYQPNGQLVDRREPGALLNADEAVVQAVSLASVGKVTTSDGTAIELSVDTLCLHSDTADAVILASTVQEALAAVAKTDHERH